MTTFEREPSSIYAKIAESLDALDRELNRFADLESIDFYAANMEQERIRLAGLRDLSLQVRSWLDRNRAESADPIESERMLKQLIPALDALEGFGRLLQIKSYLTRLDLPPQNLDLVSLRDYLLMQLRPTLLEGNPTLFQSVLAAWQRFRTELILAYREVHAHRIREARDLSEILRRNQDYAAALERLNRLEWLGPPLGSDYIQRFSLWQSDPILSLLRVPLPAMEGEEFPRMPLPMTHRFAFDDVRSTVQGLHEALREQLRRLGRLAVGKVLAESPEPKVETLLRVIQLADIEQAGFLLDEQVLLLLDRLFGPSK